MHLNRRANDSLGQGFVFQRQLSSLLFSWFPYLTFHHSRARLCPSRMRRGSPGGSSSQDRATAFGCVRISSLLGCSHLMGLEANDFFVQLIHEAGCWPPVIFDFR